MDAVRQLLVTMRPKPESRAKLLALAVSLLLAGHVLLAGGLASAVSPAPALEVLEVTTSPGAVGPGEPVQVEAKVYNPLAQDADFTVVLMVDDALESQRVVHLSAGAVQRVRFSVVRPEPGAHVVRVGPHAATFQVLPAQLSFRSLSIEPPIAAPGEPVVVRVTLENVGAAPGVFQVPLSVNGMIVNLRNILLAVGGSQVVSFEISESTPGSYAVLVGDRAGTITIAAPAFQISVPSTVPISLPSASAGTTNGTSLAVTQDKVRLTATVGLPKITLPAALPTNGVLGYFRDPVSGIQYDGSNLLIPLRDALYQEVARLVVTPQAITGLGTAAEIAPKRMTLVILDINLLLPRSASAADPVSFGIEIPLRDLQLDTPLQVTPGLRPPPSAVAAIELEARAGSKSLAQVLATATVEAPPKSSIAQDEGAVASFGVPASWLTQAKVEAHAVALVKKDGSVELSPISEAVPAGERTILKAKVSQDQGTFALVLLSDGKPPVISQVTIPNQIAIVGTTVDIQGLSELLPGQTVRSNAVLRINGKAVAAEPVVSAPNGTPSADFSLTITTPGEYSIAVENKEAKLEVLPRDVSDQVQVSQMIITPPQASPGQLVKLKASLSNLGPQRVASEVLLKINGAPVEARLLAVSPGETADALFELATQWDGKYTVELLNGKGEFSVARAPTAASFQVTDLRVEPFPSKLGEPVAIKFALENTGETEGTYLAQVLLNKREVDRQEIKVPGLTTVPVSISMQPQAAGVFTVQIGGKSYDFVVIAPGQSSDIALERLSVEPPTVVGGEQVAVAVYFRNRATAPTSGLLTILVNGSLAEQRPVTLKEREQSQEVFTLSRDIPGLYLVEVREGTSSDFIGGVLKGSFLVSTRQTHASWEISRLEVTPQPGLEGEPLGLSFLISNLGQQEGDIAINVNVDDVLEIAQTIRVGPQTTREVGLTLKGQPKGTHTVAVNGVQLRFTVASPSKETPVPTATPTTVASPPATTNGSRLFIAITVALLVVAGTAYWAMRGRRSRQARPQG